MLDCITSVFHHSSPATRRPSLVVPRPAPVTIRPSPFVRRPSPVTPHQFVLFDPLKLMSDARNEFDIICRRDQVD